MPDSHHQPSHYNPEPEQLVGDYPMADAYDFDPNSTMNDENFKKALANSLQFK